ncbi:MAG TPA: low specificity L-threonine aldolase [Vicinamibacterales bacterium]|nr:low specificity L-threonine aldolase [Vicinamibacterales bacterium]
MNFGSDNVHGVDEAILDAIRAANTGTARAYGYDEWTAETEQRFRDVFECDLAAYLVVTGTAANSLALTACCPPYGAVVCHAEAHITTDECGAPELFTGGAKLMGVRGPACKLTPAGVVGLFATLGRGEHEQRPSVLSLSNATELGTLYTPSEVTALGALARERRMHLHMDGARFANAVARLGCTPAELTWQAGVDVLSFGATKNGAMGVEAVVFFDKRLAEDFIYLRKRTGQLVSKNRFLAAQMLAYLDDDRWLRNARHANAMADRLAAGFQALPGVRLPLPIEANAVFAILPQALHDHLQRQGARYLVWPGDGPGTETVGEGHVFIRLMTSFRTSAGDVDALIAAAAR